MAPFQISFPGYLLQKSVGRVSAAIVLCPGEVQVLMFGGILDDGNPMFLLKRPFLADTTVFTFGVTSVADPSVSAQRGMQS